MANGSTGTNAPRDAGKLRFRVWALAAMGIFLDGYDLFIISVSLPLIEKDLSVPPELLGLVGSGAAFGAVLGALVGGWFADRLGRKALFFVDIACFIVFALLSAFAWKPWSLILFRFLLGVGIGADYPISSSYIAEFAPARLRGRMLAGALTFIVLGSVAAAGVGLAIVKATDSVHAWRWMLASGAAPALIVVILRSATPESPRWSLSQGNIEEARCVFARLGEEIPTDAECEPRSWRELFTPRFLRRTILVTVPWFILDVAGYGITTFVPLVLTVLLSRGIEGTQGLSYVQKDIRATEDALLLEIPILVGFGFGIFLIERLGRIPLQILGFVGMTAGLGMVAWGAGPEPLLPAVLAGFALFNLSQNGPGVATFALPAELFPTRLRATAHGLAAATGKIGAALGIALFPVLKANLGLRGTALIIAAGCILAALVTLLCRVEAKGRSLEELGKG